MSKISGIIGKIAAVVAIAASIALLFTGPGGAILGGVLLSTIVAAASAVSAVAMAISQATMKPPDMQGTVSQVMIGKNLPVPLVMGKTYVGGMQVYDKSANGPDNYDRTQIFVGSAGGPIEAFISLQADYTPITIGGSAGGLIGPGMASGFYSGYMWANSRKGLQPETALTTVPPRVAFSQWGPDYKLSGYAAWSVTMEFDEDGERYASGIPQYGVIAKWTKVYDPRKDSTYPGGSGTQRWDSEATWEYGVDGVGSIAQGENPALHCLAYARGRFSNGVRVVGCGLPKEDIRIDQFVELANLCDVNEWRVGGAVYEGLDVSRWDNIKRILQAAACEPAWTGGALGLRITTPRVAIFDIGLEDLADGEVELTAMKGWRDRINTVVPRVRLEDQKWEYTQINAVVNPTYLLEDGEEKTKEIQYDLVQQATQGAELAAYDIVNSRELGPWSLPLKPYMMPFRIGEAGNVDLGAITGDATLGIRLATIIGRAVDPGTGIVTLTLETETTAKHAYALGQVGVAPPSPTIIPPQELDQAVSGSGTVPPAPISVTLVTWSDTFVVRTEEIMRADTYRWRFYLADGVTLKREVTTTIPQVEYTKAQAHSDGISRDYKVQVVAQNAAGNSVAFMSATFSNPAPAAPTAVVFADGTSTSTVTFTPSVSLDASGHLVAYSTNAAFNPASEGAVFLCSVSPAYSPQLPAATYYGKVAAVDLWSSAPGLINFSAEDTFVITPGGGGSPPPGGGGGGVGGGGGGGIHEP